MVWVLGNPAARILANTLAGLLRANNLALDTGLKLDHDFQSGGVQDGHHKQITLNDKGGDDAGLAGHLTIWNNSGVLKWRNTTGTVRKVGGDGDVIPAGTKMWFFANTAPTGWVIDATVTDGLLALKGGTPYATGGAASVGGTWTQPGHTHTTTDLKLTAAQSGVPAHTHSKTGEFLEKADGTANIGVLVNSGTTTTGANAAADAAAIHNHGATAAGATADSWRPTAAVGILATKSAY